MLFWREKWPKVQYSCENRSRLPKSLHNFMAEGPFCSFEKYSSASCGNSSHYLLNKEYVPLRSCNRDISNHLRRVKTSQANIDGEWHLILLRVGLFEEQGETLTICPQHRDILGTLWNSSRPPTKCSHPLHGASNAKPDRGISAAFSKAILDHWGLFIPTGSGKYFALISLL